jgi:hypothetical protein
MPPTLATFELSDCVSFTNRVEVFYSFLICLCHDVAFTHSSDFAFAGATENDSSLRL